MSEAPRILEAAPRILDVARLDCAYEPRDWAFARGRAGEIDAHWAGLLAANPKLFNGRVLLLHRGEAVRARDGGLEFRGGYLQTDFKNFLAWRDFGFPDAGVRNGFAMAALSCADGAFLLGEMGAHTANPGKIYFAAGTPDPGDIVGDKVDLTGSVMRELGEETGLAAGDVVAEPGWTLVLHGPRVACMKRMRVALPAEDLRARIHATLARQAEPELARMHIYRRRGDVDAAAMPEFMQAYLDHALGEAGLP